MEGYEYYIVCTSTRTWFSFFINGGINCINVSVFKNLLKKSEKEKNRKMISYKNFTLMN
jgi:hypothetical protein